jgi:hypothetical protein
MVHITYLLAHVTLTTEESRRFAAGCFAEFILSEAEGLSMT